MNEVFYVIAVIMFLVTFFGCSINGAIVYVVLVNKQLQNVNNTFVMSMCINGFLISSFGTVFSAATSVRGEWIFGDSVCQFHSFIVFFLGLAIIATLTAMAIEKYVVIKFESRNVVTKRVCIYMLLACHLYGFIIACMPLLGWNRYQLEGYNVTCSLKMDGEDANSTSFNIFMLVIGLMVPLSLMVVFYSRIIATMREKRKSASFNTYSCHRKTVLSREMKVTKTILCMIGAFSLAWSPYAIHCIVSMLGLTRGMSPFTATVPALLAKTSVIYHPCIYIYKNKPLKAAVRKAFLCWRSNKRHDRGTLMFQMQRITTSNKPLYKPTDNITITNEEDMDFSVHASVNMYSFPTNVK